MSLLAVIPDCHSKGNIITLLKIYVAIAFLKTVILSNKFVTGISNKLAPPPQTFQKV